jgi:hypothetical protein
MSNKVSGNSRCFIALFWPTQNSCPDLTGRLDDWIYRAVDSVHKISDSDSFKKARYVLHNNGKPTKW